MKRTMLTAVMMTLIFTVGSRAASQSPPDEERRAAITLLRAINTAEAAVTSRSGHYVALPELIDHGAMTRIKPEMVMSGAAITYHGAQVRLALSADATQYVVTVVTGAPNYTAAFTDERGVIYTGKALE